MIVNGVLLPGVPVSARYHVAGVTPAGPYELAVRLTSMGDYRRVFGTRTPATAALYDDLSVFFFEGGAEAYVTRVPAGSTPEQYVAALEATAEGADGACVAVPELDASTVGGPLCAHAAGRNRVALLAAPAGAQAAEAAAAAKALAGVPGASGAVLLWPWVRYHDAASVARVAPPTGFAAAARARAHAQVGFWHHPAGIGSAARRVRGLVGVCDRRTAWELGDALVSALSTGEEGVCLWGWWSLGADRSNFPHLTSRELLNGVAVALSARYAAIGSATWSSLPKFTSQVRSATKATLAGLAARGAFTPTPEGTDLLEVDDGYRYTVRPDVEASVVRVEVLVRPAQYARMVGSSLVRVPLDVPLPTPAERSVA